MMCHLNQDLVAWGQLQGRVTFTTYHIPSTNWLMDAIGLYRRKYAFSVLIASSLLPIDKIFVFLLVVHLCLYPIA